MTSAFSSRAIAGSGFLADLYCMVEVREMTCRLSILARSVVSASVMPSAKRSEEHTSELQSRGHLVCRLLLEKKKKHRILHNQMDDNDQAYTSDKHIKPVHV